MFEGEDVQKKLTGREKSLFKRIFWKMSDKTRDLEYWQANKLWASYTGK